MTELHKPKIPAYENFGALMQPGLWRYLLLASPLLAMSAVLAFLSDGCYHDDDLGHFLKVREAGIQLLDIWGRPGFTVPYATVGWIGNAETGWLMCRLLTVAIVGATACFTGDVARRLRLQQPELAVLLFLTTPLSFVLSFTTLTESICGLYLIVGTWLILANRNWESALFWSIAMTTRHEAVVYLVPVGLYFLWRRDLVAAILLGWAEVAWNAATWWAIGYDYLPWRRYVEGEGDSGFGSGSAFTGLQMWIDAVGPGLAVAALIGSIVLLVDLSKTLRSRDGGISDGKIPQSQDTDPTSPTISSVRESDQGNAPCKTESCRIMGTLIVVGGGLGMVALQTMLYMFNRYESGGYARFLVPGAPWMSICAAAGLLRLWSIAFANTSESRPSDRRVWNGCTAHLGIALLVGVIIAANQGSLQAFYVQPLQLFFLLTAASGVAIAASKVRFKQPVIVVYLLLLIASGVSWGLELKPLRKTPDQRLAAEAAGWIRNSTEYRDRKILTNSIWFRYSSGQLWCGPDDWASAPAEWLLLYEVFDDSLDSNSWMRVRQDQVPSRVVRTWMLTDSPEGSDKPSLVLFEKLSPTNVD